MAGIPYWCCCYPCGWGPPTGTLQFLYGVLTSTYANTYSVAVTHSNANTIQYLHPTTGAVLWQLPCFNPISYTTLILRANSFGNIWAQPLPLYFGAAGPSGSFLLACHAADPIVVADVSDGIAGGGSWIGIWRGALQLDGPVFSGARLSTTTAGCWRWRKSDGTWPVAPGTPMWSIGGIAGQFSTPTCPLVGSYSVPNFSNACGSGVRFTGVVS